MLTSKERYEIFKDVFSHCGTFLTECDEEEVGWHIFEEFDTDALSFLHENTMNILLAEGYITEEIYENSLLLASSFRKMERTPLWNTHDVIHREEWRKILVLADKISAMLEEHEKK
jgi:hypothetical protein